MRLSGVAAQRQHNGAFLIGELLDHITLDRYFEGVINGLYYMRRRIFGNHDAKRFTHRQIWFNVRNRGGNTRNIRSAGKFKRLIHQYG